ncbi:MAG: hypothetical protein SPK32_10415, partial [Bacteroidaceae bacterium]|nr:hypothetical protein [Bacteroidaceae bacterium]
MNFNFFGRLGAKLALTAVIVGSLSLASCEKETFDVNSGQPGSGQNIVIPGVDLSDTNALIQAILDKIKTQQYDQLQAILNAITTGDATLKGELTSIVDQLKQNDLNNQQKLTELSTKLDQVITAINALNDKVVNEFNEAINAINNKDNGSAAVIEALNNAVLALKSASAENAQNIINGLKSDYSTLLKELKSAIENAHDEELASKLQEVLTAINDKDEFTADDLKAITDKLADILNEIKTVNTAVQALNNLITAQNTDLATVKAYLEGIVTNSPAAIQALLDAVNAGNKANIQEALTDLKAADKENYDKIIDLLTTSNNKLNMLTELYTLIQENNTVSNMKLNNILEAIRAQNTTLANKFKEAIDAANDQTIAKLAEILEQIKTDNADLYNMLAEILLGVNQTEPAEADDAANLPFVDDNVLPEESNVVTPEETAAQGTQNETTGEYFYVASCEVPNAGATRVTQDAINNMLSAIDNGDIYTGTPTTASRKYTRADDADLTQAKILLKRKVNDLGANTSWSSTTNKLFAVTGVADAPVLGVTASFKVKSVTA